MATLVRPNVFVQLDAATCERKIAHHPGGFPFAAIANHGSPSETFWATLRLRGIECRSRTGFAEGFFCRKLVLA